MSHHPTHARLLAEISQAGTWQFMQERSIFAIDPATARLLGLNEAASQLTPAAFHACFHADDRARLESTWHDFTRHQSSRFQCEARLSALGPTDIWVELRADWLPDHKAIAGIILNVSHRHALAHLQDAQHRALHLMTCAAQSLIRHDNEVAMLEDLCNQLVELGGYQHAWISQAVDDQNKQVLPLVASDVIRQLVADLDVSWADVPSGQGPTGRAIRNGVPVVIQDILNDPSYHRWHAFALATGARSTVSLPLRVEGKVIGTLNLYADRANVFDDQEIQMLCNLAGEISIGIAMQRSRAALIKREFNLRQAERMARLGHFEFDPHLDRWRSSPMLDEIFGIDADFVRSNQSWMEIVHPDDRALLKADFRHLIRTRQTHFDIHYRIIRRDDGALCHVHGIGEMEMDENGWMTRMFGTIQDITEQREAEENLRKRTQAIEQSPHSIVITNLEPKIEYVNAAFTRVTGYGPHEVIGENPAILHSGLTPAATFQQLWTTLQRGEIWRGEFTNRRKNGQTYTEFAIISPIRQPDGSVTHYLAIKEDITEKKRIEAELEQHRHHLQRLVEERTHELRQAKEQAEAASHAKSAFLANMSHEIRTPMNAILGLTHISLRESQEPEQQQRLTKVSNAAQNLLAIINDILDFSKIEAEKLVLEARPLCLDTLFKNVIGMVSERSENRGLPILTHIDPELPGTLMGDALRLQQILLNYLTNALKFTERGHITLRAFQESHCKDGIRVRFEVQDTGIGIPQDIQQRLFQPFEQADTSTTRRYGGTGLGLAISRKLAEAMQGETGVISHMGQGSTFWFTACLGIDTPAALSPATPALPAMPPASGMQACYQAMRVLLVEDNPINQEVTRELLESIGLTVDIADDGKIACDRVQAQPYDLILMDMQMPVMDGLEATRFIRSLPAYRTVPILAMTANAFSEDRNACFAAGMNDHVSKPVQPEVLYHAIATWLAPEHAAASTQAIRYDLPSNMPPLEQRLNSVIGLDVAAGLHAVRGRLDSYARLLGKFAETHAGDFAAIRQARRHGHDDEARRLAHSLKGAAATLGITPVHTIASKLEAAIRNQDPGVPALLAECESRYHEIAHQLATVLVTQSPTPESSPVTPDEIQQVLSSMRQLLTESDLGCLMLLKENRAALREGLGARHGAFETAVSNFDFDAALSLIREAEKQI